MIFNKGVDIIKLYQYADRTIIDIDGKRYNYSHRKYNQLLDLVIAQTFQTKLKVYNPYVIIDGIVYFNYYQQNIQSIITFTIDLDDFNIINKQYWSVNNNGYIFSRSKGQTVFLHHKILNVISKDLQNQKLVVDHIDRNPLNNCKENLRIVSFTINNRNHDTTHYQPESGYHNISFIYNKQHDIIGIRVRITDQYQEINYRYTIQEFGSLEKCFEYGLNKRQELYEQYGYKNVQRLE